MAFKVPENYRVINGTCGSPSNSGNNGLFIIPLKGDLKAQVICSDGMGWEHVSVTLIGRQKAPLWRDMCKIKGMFWDKEDTVVQFHPAEAEYVNNHNYCLHLWRPIGREIPLPPTELIGIKELGTLPE